MSPQVSVIVPCFLARSHLTRCLASLTAQSLNPAQFEVILIFNGPDDSGEALSQESLAGSPLRHQIIHSQPGAGHARNVGIAAAQGVWTTLLDVDDELSPNYLELMLNSASDPSVVPVAGIVDESYDGVESEWWFNATLISTPQAQSPDTFYPHLTLNAGKLIPTAVMQRHPFSEELRSGEDIVLYCDLFDEAGLTMSSAPAIAGARYRRHVTASSVSRQTNNFDFMVSQRLAVIAHLNDQLDRGPRPLDGVRRVSIASQSHFLRRYLRQHPEQEAAVDEAIAAQRPPRFSQALRPTPPQRALVCHEFSPSGTSGSREIIDWMIGGGLEWQVVSSASTQEMDWALTWASALSVARHDRIPLPLDPSAPAGHDEFVAGALASLADMGDLTDIVTMGAWPAAHRVGAEYRARTGARWTAHLSAGLPDADLARTIDIQADEVQFISPRAAAEFRSLLSGGSK